MGEREREREREREERNRERERETIKRGRERERKKRGSLLHRGLFFGEDFFFARCTSATSRDTRA
jgi:hypothetical protein